MKSSLNIALVALYQFYVIFLERFYLFIFRETYSFLENLFIFREKEKERVRRGRTEREGEREPQADSIPSEETNGGLINLGA